MGDRIGKELFKDGLLRGEKEFKAKTKVKGRGLKKRKFLVEVRRKGFDHIFGVFLCFVSFLLGLLVFMACFH